MVMATMGINDSNLSLRWTRHRERRWGVYGVNGTVRRYGCMNDDWGGLMKDQADTFLSHIFSGFEHAIVFK